MNSSYLSESHFISPEQTFVNPLTLRIAASAPRLWSALPRELKIATPLICFKRLLKTHLFGMWNNSWDRNVLVYEGLDIDVVYVLL